jgi:hypothetical protein
MTEKEHFINIIKAIEESNMGWANFQNRFKYAMMLHLMLIHNEVASSAARKCGFSEYEARIFEKNSQEYAIGVCRQWSFQET